jgi:hypothetical protein
MKTFEVLSRDFVIFKGMGKNGKVYERLCLENSVVFNEELIEEAKAAGVRVVDLSDRPAKTA